MSSEQVVRAALQQQAVRLRDEYSNLEEIRSLVKPLYNQQMQRAEIQFTTPVGICRVWWADAQWHIIPPTSDVMLTANPKTLRHTLNRIVQRLQEREAAPAAPAPAPAAPAPAPAAPAPAAPAPAAPMADVSKAPLEELAGRLRTEYSNLEELRTARPIFNYGSQQAELHFETPLGDCVIWWEVDVWRIKPPEEPAVLAFPGKLREMVNSILERLAEDAILDALEKQRLFLRNEYHDLDEIFSWTSAVYDHENQRAEIRFDSPAGICRVWMDNNCWHILIPTSDLVRLDRGKLREYLVMLRQQLYQGMG